MNNKDAKTQSKWGRKILLAILQQLNMGMRGIMNRIVVPSEVEESARLAVDAAFAVHRELGPGLLESAYQACFAYEMDLRGIKYQRELPVPLHYKGRIVEVGFRADLVIGQRLLIELKAVEQLLPVHKAQVITYLKLLRLPLGLLVNFNEVLIKNGLQRVLNLCYS